MILLLRQLLVRTPRRRLASSTRDPFFTDPAVVEDDYRRMRRN